MFFKYQEDKKVNGQRPDMDLTEDEFMDINLFTDIADLPMPVNEHIYVVGDFSQRDIIAPFISDSAGMSLFPESPIIASRQP